MCFICFHQCNYVITAVTTDKLLVQYLSHCHTPFCFSCICFIVFGENCGTWIHLGTNDVCLILILIVFLLLFDHQRRAALLLLTLRLRLFFFFFSDQIVLWCRALLTQWLRLSNWASISAQMKRKKKEMNKRTHFCTDTFSHSVLKWNESILGLGENLITLGERKEGDAVPPPQARSGLGLTCTHLWKISELPPSLFL